MPCQRNDGLKLVEGTIKKIRIAYLGAVCVKGRVLALGLHLTVYEYTTHSGWFPCFMLRSDDSMLHKAYVMIIARKRCLIGSDVRPR